MICTIDDGSMVKKIDYPGTGNNSQFTYDGLGRNVQIVEISGGTTIKTSQFVWSDSSRREERDATGTVVKQFFPVGQINYSGGSGSNQYFTIDHLGSIRESVDSSQNILSSSGYDPFGRQVDFIGSRSSDVGYAGYYIHNPSGLALTPARAYSSSLGRWLSRDPHGGEYNRYAYVENKVINFTDPSGLYGTQDFWNHYFDGNGTSVNLGSEGLAGQYESSSEVQNAVSNFTDVLKNAAAEHALNVCSGGATGTYSLPFSVFDRVFGGVHVGRLNDNNDFSWLGSYSNANPGSDLYAVGGSSFYRQGKCRITVNCCRRTYSGTCENHFYIQDYFQDPLGLGFELPGGTVYPIEFGFYRTIQVSGRF